MLVRGVNREQNFIDFCPSSRTLTADGLALRQEILLERGKAYGEGAAEPIRYADAAR